MGNMGDSWLLLLFTAFTFGLRHGFDLDHLATIDAMARAVRSQPLLSRLAGCLFSMGHGFVVILASLIIGSGMVHAQIPLWFEEVGKGISIFFLFTFGMLNLWTVVQNPSNLSAVPKGIQSYFAEKVIGEQCGPGTMLAVGALFALSFDTFSQVAFFSLSASLVAGWMFSGFLGLFFMLGMMASDGLNGLFVSALIQRADRASMIISRGLGMAISLFSLILAVTGLLTLWQ
jgi:high-affinity nickel-transport protein